MADILEIKSVSKTYNADSDNPVKALNSVDLNVAEGEFVSIIGPSGCGKSTLFKALTGEQLGEKVVFDLSGEDEHVRGLSLGSLIAMGRRHEQVEGEAANYAYYFVLTDGHLVECEARVYDKIVDYVDRLESIPVEEGSRPRGAITLKHKKPT